MHFHIEEAEKMEALGSIVIWKLKPKTVSSRSVPVAALESSPPDCWQSHRASDSVTFSRITVFFLWSHLR